MISLIVSLERNGRFTRVGSISGKSTSDAQFCYSNDYLLDPDASALSISLPLRKQPYSPSQTKCFFEGLLPEGFTRHSVARWMHADENDYLSILHGLGRECLGAICVSAEGEEAEEASYERISEQQIRDLAAEGADKSTELVMRSHLSLAGASGKAGLYYAGSEAAWYLPRGSAPSTHIVKQSHIRLESLVINERLSLNTASRCGIAVPNSFIINTGKGEEQEILFATARFDRVFSSSPRIVSGLPRPLRLHQEDFAQAMGIPPNAKYERESDSYMKEMFDLLRKYSSDPVADQLKLWDILIFNYLIGNTDAHIKNFSLMYSPDLKSIRLAPAYDIVSTTVYRQSTRDMAFRIGGTHAIDDITADSFRVAAGEAGLGEKMAMHRFELMCKRFRTALEQSSKELVAAGYPKAGEIEERILQTGGFAAFRGHIQPPKPYAGIDF